MSRVVHDNIPELMKQDGKELVVRTAKDGREFFSLLQSKMTEDIAAISNEKTAIGKAKRIADLDLALLEFVGPLNQALAVEGTSYSQFVSERQKRVGTFSRRLVTDTASQQVVSAKSDAEIALAYGAEKAWPEVVIARSDDGKPYLTVPQGEEAWLSAVKNEENAKLIMKIIHDDEQEKS